MQLYHALPLTNYRWTTSPIDSIKYLRSPKQGLLNQVVLARMELIRLIAFSAGECAIHMAAAAAKLTAAVMQLPLYPILEVLRRE